jgi:hypothetical protein
LQPSPQAPGLSTPGWVMDATQARLRSDLAHEHSGLDAHSMSA